MPINFFKGHPTLGLLPHDKIAKNFSKVITENQFNDFSGDPDNRHPLQYGTDPGNLEVRRSVSRWTNSKFGRKSVNPDQVNLTAGASFGAANVLSACTRPDITHHAFIVSPTYFLINYAFIDADFDGKMTAVVETPGQQYEIDLALLETKLKRLDLELGLEPVSDKEINIIVDPTSRGERKYYRYVMYLIPTFSNPGGLTYSSKTRKELLRIAREHDMLLVCDDVYDYLSYDGKTAAPKISHIDEDTLPKGWKYGNTVSNCSFSKIIAPGLRVGWQETASSALAMQLATTGANKSGGTPGQLNSLVVQQFIDSGELDNTISTLAKHFLSRSETLKKGVFEHLPECVTLYGGDGGYFFWVQFNHPEVNVAELLAELQKDHNVIIPEGSYFEVNGDAVGWGSKGARLCVALLTEDEIAEGLEKWGQVLRRKYPTLY